MVIGQITPIGFKHLGYKYFFVYMCTNLLNIVIAYFFFPETKNKSLEEIGLLFGDTNVRTAVAPREGVEKAQVNGLNGHMEDHSPV